MYQARVVWGLLGLLCLAPLAQAAPKAKILEYGYYQFVGDSTRQANAEAITGYATKGTAKLVEQTTRIPVSKGTLFGFQFHIWGLNASVGVAPVELIVKHPLMKKPDGSVSTGYRYVMDLKLNDGEVKDKMGYRTNEDYEVVEGEWSFEFRFMNKTLLMQKFTTFKSTGKELARQ
jgi:hypothetical protein